MKRMINKYSRLIEIIFFAIAVIFGLAVAAYIAQPIDRYFLTNFSYYWGSQLCVLVLLLPFKPRLSMLGGAAFSLALYLGAFQTWFFLINRGDALGWLGYFSSLPGAVVGAIIGIVRLRKSASDNSVSSIIISTGYTLAGVFINQLLVCGTVMHCYCGK